MRAVTASVNSCVLERFEDRLVFCCGELMKSPLPTQQTNIFSKSTIEITRKRCDICYGDFIVNFEHILQLFLVLLLLTLGK